MACRLKFPYIFVSFSYRQADQNPDTVPIKAFATTNNTQISNSELEHELAKELENSIPLIISELDKATSRVGQTTTTTTEGVRSPELEKIIEEGLAQIENATQRQQIQAAIDDAIQPTTTPVYSETTSLPIIFFSKTPSSAQTISSGHEQPEIAASTPLISAAENSQTGEPIAEGSGWTEEAKGEAQWLTSSPSGVMTPAVGFSEEGASTLTSGDTTHVPGETPSPAIPATTHSPSEITSNPPLAPTFSETPLETTAVPGEFTTLAGGEQSTHSVSGEKMESTTQSERETTTTTVPQAQSTGQAEVATSEVSSSREGHFPAEAATTAVEVTSSATPTVTETSPAGERLEQPATTEAPPTIHGERLAQSSFVCGN